MTEIRRVFLIVLDAVGVGAMPDAAEYGSADIGSNTLGHVAEAAGGLALPNLGRWGLGRITAVRGTPPEENPAAAFGKCALAAPNKDTVSGHWEMMGAVLDRKLPVFPDGFSDEILGRILAATGVMGWLGNKPASGTEIIDELGARHLETGFPIVYTSADSVFQVAAHEQAFGLERLYSFCEVSRKILIGKNEVARVIARPFTGHPGAFQRTANRHDYAIPPAENAIDRLAAAGIPVHSIGKISDVFLGRGITTQTKTKTNADGVTRILEAFHERERGFVFANLVDFDSQYGHRNDPAGFALSLREFDEALPAIEAAAQADDLVILASDHGNDPTTPGTDHTREYCLLLAFRRGARGVDLGTRASLADLGATLLEAFGLPALSKGTSFLRALARPAIPSPSR